MGNEMSKDLARVWESSSVPDFLEETVIALFYTNKGVDSKS